MADHVPVPRFLRLIEEPFVIQTTLPLNARTLARFSVEREIGRGGAGVVYQVTDKSTGGELALKTLQWADAAAVHRFKQEFRTLADVAHPNLVRLYELVGDGTDWYFTMEFVPGRDLIDHIRGDPPDHAVTVPDPATARPRRTSREMHPAPPPDPERLRTAFRQLVRGVAFLHRIGKVHRDIKPPNVLVDPTGRVVLLDFGLAAEFDPGTETTPRTLEDGLWGTLEYMSPEQCRGESATPASDWYAVGIILFQALTGQLPFEGNPLAVMNRKQAEDPTPVSSLVAGAPPDLIELCERLIARSPHDRPSDLEICAAVGLEDSGGFFALSRAVAGDAPLVGRSTHLAALETAFEQTTSGWAVLARVQGDPGTGKSTLIEHFTATLRQERGAVVLTGRCHIRETVPYKALDGAVDTLSRILAKVDESYITPRLPVDLDALVAVFPTLLRIDAIRTHVSGTPPVLDRLELRRRAVGALHDVLAQIAAERPLILTIDDLQWADRDSVNLLVELLDRARNLPMLVLLSYRPEAAAQVRFLRPLLSAPEGLDQHDIIVGELPMDHAVHFAEAMLRRWRPDRVDQAQALARETGGNPFLLDQIVRWFVEKGGLEGSSVSSLDEMLDDRLARMPAGTRSLMDVLALAGQPIPAVVAGRAADLNGELRWLVTTLSIGHLVLISGRNGHIEPYHDRIREHFLARIHPERARELHRRLAESLEAHGDANPEALYEHCLGAGLQERAAGHAARTAQAAQAALAFERAADFFQRAIDLAGPDAAETTTWRVGLGDALACAARSGAAAQAYLQAAEHSEPATALELERLAGEQLLISGRTDEGLEVIKRVLAKVKLRFSPSPRRALLALLFRRVRLRLRGVRFRERREDQIPRADLARIDVCWAVAEGLAFVDNIHGAAFQSLHLLLALRAGEPHRIARALAIEAGYAASAGKGKTSARLLREAHRLAARLDSPYALGLCKMIAGVEAYYDGRWAEALAHARDAHRRLSRHVRFVAWQLTSTKLYQIQCTFSLGNLEDLTELTRSFLREAYDHGNVFERSAMQTGWSNLMWLFRGDIDGARDALLDAERHCAREGFHIPHFFCLIARGQLALYTDDAEAGFDDIEDRWRQFRRSMLLRIRTLRVNGLHLRGRVALGAAAAGREDALPIAEECASRLRRDRVAWARALGDTLTGGIATLRGDRPAAIAAYARAEGAFDTVQMALWRTVAAHARGEVEGTESGRATCEDAERWLADQHVADPARLARTLVPRPHSAGSDISAGPAGTAPPPGPVPSEETG